MDPIDGDATTRLCLADCPVMNARKARRSEIREYEEKDFD
jgi:hypothetical protein